MKRNQILAFIVALILLLVSCSGGSGSHPSKDPKQSGQSGGNESASGKSGGQGGGQGQGQGGGQGQEEEQGEPHEYIQEAMTVKIEPLESEKLDITNVVFVGEKKIAIACPKDIGTKKSFLYDLESKQVQKLPDNMTVIKKLENDDLFVNTGSEGSYAILDGSSFTMKKEIKRPANVDMSLDLSPDSKYLSYVTSEGLFVSDLDFQNPIKLIPSKLEEDEFKTELPRYPKWLDNGRISYKMLAWETVKYCGVIMRDATNGRIYENARDTTIYPLISGDFLYRGEYGKGVGVIDGISGEKKVITQSEIAYEGFAYDKGGKWVVYFIMNNDVTEENKWTARLDISSISNAQKIKEYKSEKPNTMPIEDAVASPDGKFLLFTDLDKSGRRVLYKMEIKTEEGEGKSGS